MPYRLPEGESFSIVKRSLPKDYSMPAMEVATDHYALGYMISGDRQTITPDSSFEVHDGDVSLMPPYIYHRTVPVSRRPYENYLIKISIDCMEEIRDKAGGHLIDELFNKRTYRFPGDDGRIRREFDELYEESLKDVPYRETVMKGMLFRLLTDIWELGSIGATTDFSATLSKPVIDALYIMEKDYAADIGLDSVAKETGFSPGYFSRMFKSQMNITFSEQLSRIRLKHVQELLLQTDLSVTDIAMQTGYCTGDYLSTQFKKHFGMTPRQFRIR